MSEHLSTGPHLQRPDQPTGQDDLVYDPTAQRCRSR